MGAVFRTNLAEGSYALSIDGEQLRLFVRAGGQHEHTAVVHDILDTDHCRVVRCPTGGQARS